ncbi:MAG: alanine--tRNA ligase, partial [Oscillospiraceae bacterium]|nr:alanine--tRNA ligase [Oscillospiraceae bacterium]
INEVILSALPVEHNEMNIADAKAMGAMALFGEKYGDVVRVCNIDNYSVELCGGTHVDNTAKLGLFKIVSESSVAAGVRRIEGVTGFGVLDVLNNAENTIAKVAENLKLSNLSELVSKTEAVANELKAKDKIIEELNGKVAESKLDSIFANAKDVAGISMITASFKDMATDALKAMADKIKDKSANIVAVISSQNAEKANLMVVCGADAVKAGLHAGKLVKEIATLTGGSGGGRPDSAMAGVGDVSKLDEAIAKSYEIIENALKK